MRVKKHNPEKNPTNRGYLFTHLFPLSKKNKNREENELKINSTLNSRAFWEIKKNKKNKRLRKIQKLILVF